MADQPVSRPAPPSGLALTCLDIRIETPSVRTFRFRHTEGAPLPFLAGQAMMLGVEVDGQRLWRSFSISGSGAPDEIEMTIKAQGPGGATRWLHDHLKPGMSLPARAARGTFSLAAKPGGPVAFLSGGSGVTPLLAMLRALAKIDPDADVAWVHAASREEEILFPDLVTQMQTLMPNLSVSIVVSKPDIGWFGYRGRITRRLLSVIVPDLGRREVFCCGPDAFMREMQLIHAAEGGKKDRFHKESFGTSPSETPPSPPSSPARHAADASQFHLRAAGRVLEIRQDETVLQASLRQGVIIPCGCGEGMCGTCMVKLDHGTVRQNHNGGITPAEERDGYILACSSRPVTYLAISIG